jgi:hypothetical protein
MTSRNAFARLLEHWTALGPLGFVVDLLDRGLTSATSGLCRLRCYHVVAQPIRTLPLAGLRNTSRIQTRWIQAGDPASFAFPRPLEVIRQRFESGSSCLCATYDGEFAAYLWLQRDRYQEDEVRCDYLLFDRQSCVWDYDVYVEPSRRIGRTFAILWQEANRQLSQQGVRWTLSRIAANNPASMRSHARLGARRVALLNFLCVGPMQISMFTVPPYLHIGIGPLNRAQVQLRAPTLLDDPPGP